MIFIKIGKVEKLEIKGRRYVCLADAYFQIEHFGDFDLGLVPGLS